MKYRRKMSAIIVALILCVTMTFSFANVFAVSEGGSADLGSEKEPQQNEVILEDQQEMGSADLDSEKEPQQNEVVLENQPAKADQTAETDSSKENGTKEKDSESNSAYTSTLKAKTAGKAGAKIKSQPSVKGSIAGNDRVWATSDTPARTVNTYYIYGGWQRAVYHFKLEYEGLEPGKQYNVKRIYDNKSGAFTSTGGSFTVSDSGSGTWESDFSGSTIDFFFWDRDYTGEWNISFELTPSDENGDTINVKAPKGDKSMTVDVRGISGISLEGDCKKSVDGTTYLLKNEESDPDEEMDVVIKVSVKGLEPNKEYTAAGVISQVMGMYSYPTNITPSASKAEVTDSNGSATFEIPHKVKLGQLLKGALYTSRVSVAQTDENKTDNTRYAFYPSQVDDFILGNDNKLYVIETDTPNDEPTYINIEITNKIAGTDSLLEGAKLKLVKGKDPSGTEIVDSWTQGKEPHSLKVLPGDYVLVQESVPDDYILHQPIVLSVSEDDAQVKGYLFEAGRRSDQQDDGTWVLPLVVRKDFSNEEGEIVFCVNEGKPFGQRIDKDYNKFLYYKEYNLTDAILNEVIDNPRLPVDKLKEKLLKVVYAGFPNNKAGIMEKYSLTASEMERVTQCAIHYYTDSIDYTLGSDRIMTQAQYDALQELINTDIEVPKGTSVKIYIADDNGEEGEGYVPARTRFQNLISTSFDKEDKTVVLELANEKKQQPEEPKKPPQPNLSVKKVSSLKKAAIGDIVPYTITVTNSGDGDAKGINVKDIMGDDLEYVSDNNGGVHSGQNVDWVIDVPAGKSKVIKLNCRVKESARNKVINNVVITDPENPGEYQEYKDNVALPLSPPPNDKQNKEIKKAKKGKVSKAKKVKRIKARSAATGDDFALGLWAGLAAFSLIVLGAGICVRKSR